MEKETQNLIDRMIKAGNNQSFNVDKEKAEKCILDIYRLYNLKLPTITWCKDVYNKELLEASCASCASGASGASGASVDYDFNIFIDNFNWLQKNKGDINDEKFIKSQFLFLEAKEAGAGFFSEFKGVGHIAPRCIIKLNQENQHHSEIQPAIQWKEGLKLYFLNGIKFEKDLWQEIVSKTISTEEALKLENIEQRIIALKYIGGDKLERDLGGKIISTDDFGELIELEKLLDTNQKPYKYLKAKDPSKNEYVYIRVHPDTKTPQEAQERGYSLGRWELSYNPTIRT